MERPLSNRNIFVVNFIIKGCRCLAKQLNLQVIFFDILSKAQRSTQYDSGEHSAVNPVTSFKMSRDLESLFY